MSKIEFSIDGIGHFISDNFLKVPIYQRPYAWTEEHINDLINDLKDSFPDEYFIGTTNNNNKVQSINNITMHKCRQEPSEQTCGYNVPNLGFKYDSNNNQKCSTMPYTKFLKNNVLYGPVGSSSPFLNPVSFYSHGDKSQHNNVN